MLETLKGAHQNPKQVEQALKLALNITKLTHKETKEGWTKANRKAMAISRSILKYPEIQSILKNTKHAIDQVAEDIKSAQHSKRVGAFKDKLENFSGSKLVKTASELSVFHIFEDFNFEETMYGMWAELYLSRARLRVQQVISHIEDQISNEYQIYSPDTNPVELRANEDLHASVEKCNKAMSFGGKVSEISAGVVEEATSEMNHNVNLVQELFHASDVKAKAIIDKYKEQYAVREAEAITVNTKLALSSRRDQIIKEANENCRMTIKANSVGIWTTFIINVIIVFLIVVGVSSCTMYY